MIAKAAVSSSSFVLAHDIFIYTPNQKWNTGRYDDEIERSVTRHDFSNIVKAKKKKYLW